MRRAVHFAIAYAFAFASAVLAGLYAVLSATGPYAFGKALILCLIAFGGCHGPAFVRRLWHTTGFAGATIAGIGTAFCLLVTLWGGLGTLSAGSAVMSADRTKTAEEKAIDRAALARLIDAHGKVAQARPAGVVAPEILTAKASPRYTASDGCAPDKITAPATRQHCAFLRGLEAEHAAALEIARLDAEIAAVSGRLANAPAAVEPDPQASAFAQLTGISAGLSAALYALCASVALEFMGMAAMLNAWADAARPRLEPAVAAAPVKVEPAPKPKISPLGSKQAAPLPMPPRAERTPPRINVVTLSPPRRLPEGMVSDFASRRLSKSQGSEEDMMSVYRVYQKWCGDNEKQAIPAERFIPSFLAYCDSTGVQLRDEGKKVYCVDVKLWA